MPPERLPFAPERPAGSHLPEGAPTRAWRHLDRLVLAATMVGLLVPWTLLLAGLRPRPIENRPLATLPAVSVNGLLDGSWFRGADAFVADNVFVRPYAIRVRGEAYWLQCQLVETRRRAAGDDDPATRAAAAVLEAMHRDGMP